MGAGSSGELNEVWARVEVGFDSGRIGKEFGPNRIAIGLTVFVRYETVVRLLEF